MIYILIMILLIVSIQIFMLGFLFYVEWIRSTELKENANNFDKDRIYLMEKNLRSREDDDLWMP